MPHPPSPFVVWPFPSFPGDLKELSEAIARPLVDATVAFPPAAVLGLARIVVCVLMSEQRGETVTAFSNIGVKSAVALKALTLGWEDAMRVLRRSHKLLRQLRAMSAGPSSQRPRLLYLPREAMELMAAYGDDPVSERQTRGAFKAFGCIPANSLSLFFFKCSVEI